MKYIVHGHENCHAVEEMLFHLFPADKPILTDKIPEDYCDNYIVSSAETQGDNMHISAVCVYHNKKNRADGSINFGGLSELEQKRLVTHTIKQTIFDALGVLLDAPPSWGSLTGVRPAKFTRRFLEDGMSLKAVDDLLKNSYHVSESRRALAIRSAEVAINAKAGLSPKDISIYIGIPFCPSRCYYCSFVSHSIENAKPLIAPYLDVLCAEIEQTGKIVSSSGLRVVSVYIGGGTPTTLSASQLARLLHALRAHFDLFSLKEFTVEAGRPDTIDKEKLNTLKEHGVTRISINPQSMNDEVLRAAGRHHSSEDVIKAFKMARDVGFTCINMDTIVGLDNDNPQSFSDTIDTLIALEPENITVHALSIKRGADMTDKVKNQQKCEDVSKMLDLASEKLTLAGYSPYYLYRQKFMAGGFENIGWSKAGYEGLYNIYMMEELQTVISLGAGGVTKLYFEDTNRIERLANPKYPYEYNASLKKITTSKLAILDWAKQLK